MCLMSPRLFIVFSIERNGRIEAERQLDYFKLRSKHFEAQAQSLINDKIDNSKKVAQAILAPVYREPKRNIFSNLTPTKSPFTNIPRSSTTKNLGVNIPPNRYLPHDTEFITPFRSPETPTSSTAASHALYFPDYNCP